MKTITRHAAIFAAALATSGLISLPAAAQDNWPSGPIQVVVPFGAGGDTDFNARVLSKYLEPELGVAMPVINVTGAGGSIGARQVLGAKPDGQTVLFFHSAMLVNSASGIADFSWNDFEIAAIAGQEAGLMLVTQGDAPWNDVSDLVKATQDDPQSIDLTINTGATTYMTGSLLQKAGAAFNFVDVGGSADRLTAVLGGNVDVVQNPLGQVKPYIDSGELKALGTFARDRSEALPDVATLKEQGFDIEFQYTYFYLFPKGTPSDTVDRFSTAVQQVIESDGAYANEIRQAYWQEPLYLGPDAAAAALAEQDAIITSVDY